MTQSNEERVIEKFRERLSDGDLSRIHIVNRITGGTPGEGRIEQEFWISGKNEATIRIKDAGAPLEEASSKLKENDVHLLFQKVSKGIDSLVTREKANFIPDSVVGSITIEVDGEEATFFYLADEDEREAQKKPVSRKMKEALDKFSLFSKRLQKKRGK
jgi:hypothetical protein